MTPWTRACAPELVDPSLVALASIWIPGAEIGGLSSWTQARGPELVDLMLGTLASIRIHGAQIGSWSSWTQAHGPQLVGSDLVARLLSRISKLFRVFLQRCNIYIYIYI